MFVKHNYFNMKFVGRKKEIARLKETLKLEKPVLAVLYGRRRIGKSTLIKRVISENDIYFLADRSENHHQLMLLSEIIAKILPDFQKVNYPDWETLLRTLNYRSEKRFTLCLDEFPYIVEQAPELPSVLQKLIDEKQLKYNIILCGSSQNMMYGLCLDSSAPLYGRADTIMRLSPLKLPDLKDALSLDPVETIQEYSVWGGVPRYWELRENRTSLYNALWDNVLSPNGTLYEEPVKLFQDDLKDLVKTATIMSYIGTGANRLSEIASRCQEPATNLSRPLKKLIDLGFLLRDIPFGVDEKNAKKSIYKIADPFMSFYYRFVVPNRSFIELERKKPIEQALNEHLSEYISNQWETLCREAITGNSLNGVIYGKAKRWWGTVNNEDGNPEQIEIDVIAESLDKKYLLVGECKWTSQENTQNLNKQLLRKAKLLPFAQNRTIVPVLFLKNPPQKNTAQTLLPKDIIQLLK